MNLKKIVTVCTLLWVTATSYGQSATLTTDTPAVSPGTVVTVTASASYSSAPGAAGWIVTLPEGWSFVATSGPDAPQVGPAAGATGTLEWAYAMVPAAGARFGFTVRTGDKPGAAQLKAKVYLRVDGKQQAVEVQPLQVTVGA